MAKLGKLSQYRNDVGYVTAAEVAVMIANASGLSGYSGASGYSGKSGYSGYSGISGYSGYSA